MKNIHVLQTDKPSRLAFIHDKLYFDKEEEHITSSSQNIYITNDEEINQNTKPCWCLNTIKKTWNDDVVYFQGTMPQYHYIGFKKIILTTDQDLITNGVQAIPEYFLEWFIEKANDSGKAIDIIETKSHLDSNYFDNGKINYQIIIPKEEPKQETLEEAGCIATKLCEHLEAKEQAMFIAGFQECIKWKQQQQNKNLYSEDDVPTKPEPVLAKISDINCLGKSEWLEVVYYDDKWNSYAGSKTFQNGEKVVNWKYCSEIFN